MKNGLSLTELANELESRATKKQDLLVESKNIEMRHDGTISIPELPMVVTPNDNAHKQIATRLGIPTRYYERMMEDAPDLMARNVNTWLQQSDDRRMLRLMANETYVPDMRAYLSDRYLRIENEDVARHALNTIYNDVPNAAPLQFSVTDRRMSLKFLFNDIEGEVKPGDTIKPGVLITNSEIGHGAFVVKAFFYRDFCTNGCVFGMKELFHVRRSHLGGVVSELDSIILSNETLRLRDQTLLSETTDVIKSLSTQAAFDKVLDKLRATTDGPVIAKPTAAIEVLAKAVGLNEAEKEQSLINLIQDGDFSRWGVLNSITKIANGADSFDRVNELEEIGGKIIDLPAREWKQIAEAA